MKKIEVVAQGRADASRGVDTCPYKVGSWQANAWTEGWQSWHDDAVAVADWLVDGMLRRLAGRAKFYRHMPKHRGLYPVY